MKKNKYNNIYIPLYVVFIVVLIGCGDNNNHIKKYNYTDFTNLPDSCYTIDVDMTNWSPTIPKVEFIDVWKRRSFIYNYENNIINFQSIVTIDYNPDDIGNKKESGVIVRVKNINGQYKGFYIRWLLPYRKYSEELNYFTDTTNISTNLSIDEVKKLIPGFRGKIFSGLKDSLKFDFSVTHPINQKIKINYKDTL